MLVAETFIHAEHHIIFFTDEQLKLRASARDQFLFQTAEQRIGDTAPAEFRMHAEIIRGAAMPIITAHHRADDLPGHFRHQEQRHVVIDFALDIHFRVVPGAKQVATFPQGDHFLEIVLAKNAYLHGINRLFGFKNSDYGVNRAFSQ